MINWRASWGCIDVDPLDQLTWTEGRRENMWVSLIIFNYEHESSLRHLLPDRTWRWATISPLLWRAICH
jgi:hypothetical protein